MDTVKATPSAPDGASVAASADAPDLIAAIVAPRRSLIVNGVKVGPGSRVELPADEANRLRRQGFLVDPNGRPAPITLDGTPEARRRVGG